MKYNELFWFNVLEFRARFKLENEFSSDMSYFWIPDVLEFIFKPYQTGSLSFLFYQSLIILWPTIYYIYGIVSV